MRRRRLRPDSAENKNTEKFRAVLDENTAITFYNKKSGKSTCILRRDLAKNYDIDIEASEAPALNKILSNQDSPVPFESTMCDFNILEEEVFPINDAIKHVFGLEKDLDLHKIRLAVGGSKEDYVTIEEKDLIQYDVKPTLTGLMNFVHDNKESVIGFLDRDYIQEEGNIIYLSCGKKNLSENILSVKLKILASMQQRGYFLQQEHKYYGVQLYLIVQSRKPHDDKLLELLKELEIDWELIFFRRRLSIHDWTEIECNQNAENLKNFLRSKYDTLNYFDVNNITRLVVKNELPFPIADKAASLLYQMKAERAAKLDEDTYSITLKKAEIAAASKLACAFLGETEKLEQLEFDRDVSVAEILKYEEELTNM